MLQFEGAVVSVLHPIFDMTSEKAKTGGEPVPVNTYWRKLTTSLVPDLLLSPDLLTAVSISALAGLNCVGFPKRRARRIFVWMFHWGFHSPAQPETFPSAVTLGCGPWNLPHFQNRWPLTRRFTYLFPRWPCKPVQQSPNLQQTGNSLYQETQLSNLPKMTPGKFLTIMPFDSFPSTFLLAGSINNAF